MLTLLRDIDTQTEELIEQEQHRMSLHYIYADMNLEADSAIVYNATSNEVLFSKNQSKRRPLASITKIMTALVGRTILPSSTPVTFTQSSRTEEPDLDLRLGDTWTAKDLTQYFLVKSSNDGATAVCDAVTSLVRKNDATLTCVKLMNQYAQNQGLSSLYFSNPSGLDLTSGAPSSFGSAYDVAKMLNIAYNSYPSLFTVTSEPVVTFRTPNYVYEATNTDKVLDDIKTVLAGKTGYTDTAGGNLAVLYEPRPGLHVVIVVLGASREGRFSDMLELVKHTNKYVEMYGI
jgi:D-alanyl-D-alanine carboxypeptidase